MRSYLVFTVKGVGVYISKLIDEKLHTTVTIMKEHTPLRILLQKQYLVRSSLFLNLKKGGGLLASMENSLNQLNSLAE